MFAPDLPGFGFSDRSDRRYDPALYTAAVFDMLDVIAEDQGQAAPLDALANSLSSEFLARAASQEPAAFRRLVLVTPTGFDRRSSRLRGAPGETREQPWLYSLFEGPPWRQGLFDLLVSRRSIRYFLGRTFGSDAVPDELVEYSWRSAHQPGARHAPYAFVSAALFSADIRDVYEKLTMPVWVPHGTRGDFRDFFGQGMDPGSAELALRGLSDRRPAAFRGAGHVQRSTQRLPLRVTTVQPSAPSLPRSPRP